MSNGACFIILNSDRSLLYPQIYLLFFVNVPEIKKPNANFDRKIDTIIISYIYLKNKNKWVITFTWVIILLFLETDLIIQICV